MKAVIFAGGVGSRLWPLSRKKSPKQFEKIVGDKSTLQLSIKKLTPTFKPEDIYISTGAQYVELVQKQLDFIPKENIIGEPVRRDVGPAVGFMMGYLSKLFPDEPVAILWSDHLVKKEGKFKKLLEACEEIIKRDQNRIVFIGHTPRFANQNLGWIETGKVMETINSVPFLELKYFKYRPDAETVQKYVKDPHYCWNLGYFVSTPRYMYSLFERFTPKIYTLTEKILNEKANGNFNHAFATYYAEMPLISFDNAILEQLDNSFAYVVVDDLGWSDVGAWEALKEALEESKDDNIIKGKVLLKDSKDTLVYNYHPNKLLVGIDLEDFLVVDTEDVLLVAKKTSVSKVKKMVEEFEGTVYEELT